MAVAITIVAAKNGTINATSASGVGRVLTGLCEWFGSADPGYLGPFGRFLRFSLARTGTHVAGEARPCSDAAARDGNRKDWQVEPGVYLPGLMTGGEARGSGRIHQCVT